MQPEDRTKVIEIIQNCESANDIRDIAFIEAMAEKRRIQLEDQYGVKKTVRSKWGGLFG